MTSLFSVIQKHFGLLPNTDWKTTENRHFCLVIQSHIIKFSKLQIMALARGAARIFLRGGPSYGSKSLEKEKLLVIRIVKESTWFVDKQLTVLTTKTGGPSNYPAILFLWYSFLTTAKFEKLDYTSQPSFVFIYDLFSTVGKHMSQVHVSFNFAMFNKRIKLICTKLVFFRFFPIFVSWFYQHTNGLADNIRCKHTQHAICKVTFMNFTAG